MNNMLPTSPIDLDEIQRETYRNDIAGYNVHNHLKELTVPELKKISMSDRFPFAVMALSLTGDGNIGGIVRSALLHGAKKVWIYGRRKFDHRPTVGSLNYIDHEIVNGFVDKNPGEFNIKKLDRIIVDNLYYPIFIEQLEGRSVPLQTYDWNIPNGGFIPLLIVGNETNGVPLEILQFFSGFSDIVEIPQRGVIRSFNVSNAMNIAVWDMRMKKGWF
jgi:tRNA G18 (ribose-2'-O)-methylase SpoU